MRQMRLVGMCLAFAAFVPASASARIVTNLNETRYGSTFPSACATLHYIDFSNTGGNGRLTLIIANTSDDTVEPGAHLNKLILNTNHLLPAFVGNAFVQ